MDENSRREFVKMSVPAFLGVTLMLPTITAFAKQANAHRGFARGDEPLNWDALLERVTAEAAAQLDAKTWDEARYVGRAAALARRLHLEDPVVQQFLGGYQNANPRYPEFDKTHREKLFEISLAQDEFCQVIDLFTPHYDEQHIRRSRWFEVDPEPLGGRPGLFEAETK